MAVRVPARGVRVTRRWRAELIDRTGFLPTDDRDALAFGLTLSSPATAVAT